MAKEQTLTLTLKVDDKGTVVLDKFTASVKKAGDDVGRISKAMSIVAVDSFMNIARSAINAGKQVFAFAESIAAAGDEISRNSKILNMSTTDYQKWQYVAFRSDVEAQSLAVGIKNLSRNMLAAQQGSKEATEGFEALQISIKDNQGQLKSYEAMLGDLADKFSKMADGPEKTALALKLFGRSGEALLPLFNQGREGIKGLTAEFVALGIEIDKNTIDKLSEADASFEKFRATMKRLKAELAPLVTLFADLAQNIVAWINEFRTNQERLEVQKLKDLKEALKGVEEELAKLSAGPTLSQRIFGTYEGNVAYQQRKLAELKKQIGDITQSWKSQAQITYEKGQTEARFIPKAEAFVPKKTGDEEAMKKAQAAQKEWLSEKSRLGKEEFDLELKQAAVYAKEWEEFQRQQDYISKQYMEDEIEREKTRTEIVNVGYDQNMEKENEFLANHKQAEAQIAEATLEQQEITREAWKYYWDSVVEESRKAQEQIDKSIETFGNALSDAWANSVTNIIRGTETLSDAFKNLAKSMADSFINAITKMIANWVLLGTVTGGKGGWGATGGGYGGILGVLANIFLKAEKGADFVVTKPTPILVGEAGPERVVITPGETVTTFLAAQRGIDFIATKPTPLLVGEAGPEHAIVIPGETTISKKEVNAYESETKKVSKSIKSFVSAQYGADFIVRKPTPLLVGEKGPEHVVVTPGETMTPKREIGRMPEAINLFMSAQHGADFIAKKPTNLLVGEGGAEHVMVTPETMMAPEKGMKEMPKAMMTQNEGITGNTILYITAVDEQSIVNLFKRNSGIITRIVDDDLRGFSKLARTIRGL